MNKTEERIDNNGPIHLQIDDDRQRGNGGEGGGEGG